MNRPRGLRLLRARGGGTAATAFVLALAAGLLTLGPSTPTASHASPVPARPGVLALALQAARSRPRDPSAWSGLGLAELDQGRLTLDPDWLTRADQALHRSLALQPTANYYAVVGRGMLANARHQFAAARTFGLQATAMAPDRPTGYTVLADAEIQLGHYPQATAATQRLLDLAPTVPAFTRAAYDLETHGRPAEAAIALQRALATAQSPGDRAFCQHRLGDLAWDAGDVTGAAGYYRLALASSPGDFYALDGQARTDAAQGRTDRALHGYAALVARVPLPQFLLEFAELQLALGHRDAAADQLAVLAGQVKILQALGGPVDPHLALYQAQYADPGTAVALLRGEWRQRHSVLVADALAWALHQNGQDPEALDYAHRAAATGWRSPLFAYHRGAIEAALHRPEAAADLRLALTLNPHFSPYDAPRAARLLRLADRARHE